jgi:hypothetical protein
MARRRKRLRRVLLFLICGVFAMTATIPAVRAFDDSVPEPLTPEFIRFFDTLALTEDYGPFNNRPPWVRKWDGPVRVLLDERAETLRAEIETLLTRISRWTDLSFSLLPPGTVSVPDSWNVISVKLLPRVTFQRLYKTREVVCQTETHGIGGTLQVGYMVLSDGYTDCLKHEFMHALGFDSHWYPKNGSEIHSVLAFRDSASRADDYTRWDIMAIRVLYDGRIRAGMAREKSLSIAYEVIRSRPQSAALPVDAIRGSAFR